MGNYPQLVINHEALRQNASLVNKWCTDNNILFCAVIKSSCGMMSVARDYVESGARMLASSRIEQLKRCRDEGFAVPRLMIRVPMLSEIEEVVDIADYSLNSEEITL
ncbi:MAG: alanine racemase, partial [Clostridiales bacterium]|nr:alanine racemase [Candidatus Crickella merdequi]